MFTPVWIMVAVLFVITVLLAIADWLLVSYGECKVTVTKEDDEKEFVVQGGGTLLSALVENGMNIPAACGGRGSCGYCKVNVASGGGDILPTEEVFVSKEEKRQGTRLACQVKIKEDLAIHVPDLLTTVKTMVRNGTIDTKLKWRFVLDEDGEPVEGKKVKIARKDRRIVEEIVDRHRESKGAIMPVLQDINETFMYLPEPTLSVVSKELDMPLSLVFRIATFYNAFSLKPRGKYVIMICMGTACHVKGAAGVLEAFEQHLGIKAGETTPDMLFTLDAVRCIGCCGLAPVLKINEDVHGLVTKRMVPELIERYRGVPANA